MRVEERVIAALRVLPPERQAEVADFAEFLKNRIPRSQQLRPYGLCAGELDVPDDFDAPLPDSELGLFEQ